MGPKNEWTWYMYWSGLTLSDSRYSAPVLKQTSLPTRSSLQEPLKSMPRQKAMSAAL